MCCCGKFFFPHQGPQLVATSPGLTSGIQKKEGCRELFPSEFTKPSQRRREHQARHDESNPSPFQACPSTQATAGQSPGTTGQSCTPTFTKQQPNLLCKRIVSDNPVHPLLQNPKLLTPTKPFSFPMFPPGRQGVGIGHWGETVESRTTRRISIFCECLSSIPCPLERFICTPLP